MVRSVVVSLLVALCAVGGGLRSAAQQAAPAPTGVIVGRVVDAQSNAPIAGVVVGLTGGALARGTEPTVITDAQGRFAFRGLAKGTYTIAATTSGNGFSPNGFVVTGSGFPTGPYLNGGLGQQRPNGPLQPIDLADGQRIEDAVIRMWKPAAIAGQVLDEAGEPLVAQVVGVVQISSDGRLLNGPTMKTDDRGAFRFGTLIPGTYIVFAPQTRISMPISVGEDLTLGSSDPVAESRFAASGAPRPSLGGVQVGSTIVSTTPDAASFGGGGGLITSSLGPIAKSGTITAYPTTFFPSTVSASQAGRITLGSGEERLNLIVAVRPLPCASISGTLVDDAGPVPNMGVHLLPGDLDDAASILEAGVTATDARGGFVLPAVPSGQYTLVVFRPSSVPTGNPQQPIADVKRMSDQPGAWAVQAITVGERAVDGVMLRVKPPVTVTGEVRFVGNAPAPTPDRLRGAVTISRARGMFRAPGASASSPIDLTMNGRVVIKGLSPPGRFFVGPPALPAPWTLESVTLGGRDVTDAAFQIDDSDMADLVVTYTDKPSGLSGTVTPGTGAAGSETSVCLMPANRARWAEARLSTRTFRLVRTTKSGAFAWTNVPSGDYLVAAIRDTDAADWPDEKFIAKLAAVATPIKILPGQQPGVSLNVSVLR